MSIISMISIRIMISIVSMNSIIFNILSNFISLSLSSSSLYWLWTIFGTLVRVEWIWWWPRLTSNEDVQAGGGDSIDDRFNILVEAAVVAGVVAVALGQHQGLAVRFSRLALALVHPQRSPIPPPVPLNEANSAEGRFGQGPVQDVLPPGSLNPRSVR